MPGKAPASGPQIKRKLQDLGQQIQRRRKALKVSTVATAEAARISRMTLNRIERGEPSVNMGSYLQVAGVLGLSLEMAQSNESRLKNQLTQESKITVSSYPQLKKLAWQLKDSTALKPHEALGIYERNWKHLDFQKMTTKEKEFLKELLNLFNRERPLV